MEPGPRTPFLGVKRPNTFTGPGRAPGSLWVVPLPYKDPKQQRAAKRASAKRARLERGATLDRLPEDAGGLPEPPSREFLLRALGVQAREGNVPAIRLLLEEHRRDAEREAPPADALDDLLERRRRRLLGRGA